MKKASFKKTMLKMLVCSLMMAVIIPIAGTAANAAGNIQDSRVATRYSGDGGDITTNAREKDDYTSCYIYNDRSDYHFSFVNVCGTNQSRNVSQYYDCGGNQDTSVAVGQSKYLINYVRERKYKNALLKVNPGPQRVQWVSFLWSPDSV